MADWVLNIYNAASSSSLWAPCLPSLLNLCALTGHIVLKRAMCITSDMAGILTGCKASFTKAVSFLKNTNLESLYCWKCLQWISKKENVGSWKMGPNILTFSSLIMPGFCLKTISLSKALIPTACQTPYHISVTFLHCWNMMQKAAFRLWGPVQKQGLHQWQNWWQKQIEMRLCTGVGSSISHLQTGFMKDCPSRWQVKSVFPTPLLSIQ